MIIDKDRELRIKAIMTMLRLEASGLSREGDARLRAGYGECGRPAGDSEMLKNISESSRDVDKAVRLLDRALSHLLLANGHLIRGFS